MEKRVVHFIDNVNHISYNDYIDHQNIPTKKSIVISFRMNDTTLFNLYPYTYIMNT